MSAVLGRHQGGWVILFSLLLAALLSTLPLPPWLEPYRPEWPVLVMIYWVMALPDRVGMFTAWLFGFFLDVLEGSLLGLNAMALAIVAYLTLNLYQRMRMFTPFQQSSTVLVIVGIHQLFCYWILTTTSQGTPPNLLFLASAFSSALFWPFVFTGLRLARRSFRVH